MCDRTFRGSGIGAQSRFVRRALKRNFCTFKEDKRPDITFRMKDIPSQYESYKSYIDETIEKVKAKWRSVIVSIPSTSDIIVNMNWGTSQTMGANTLGSASLEMIYNMKAKRFEYLNDVQNDPTLMGHIIPHEGTLHLNLDYMLPLRSTLYANGDDGFYYTILHEVGHILGMISIPRKVGTVTTLSTGDRVYQFNGSKAVEKYNTIFNTDTSNSFEFIPVEDDGGAGTAGSHFEEGVEHPASSNPRTINGVEYPGLDKELMTGWIDLPTTDEQNEDGSAKFILALSEITVGLLEDIGFQVDYSKADPYNANDMN